MKKKKIRFRIILDKDGRYYVKLHFWWFIWTTFSYYTSYPGDIEAHPYSFTTIEDALSKVREYYLKIEKSKQKPTLVKEGVLEI